MVTSYLRIICKAAINEFVKQQPAALEPLMHWYRVAKRAQWQNLMEVRKEFPHADSVGEFTVFKIGGNKWRLIAVIKYRWQVIYVRHIFTHAEYDEEKWK